MIMRAHKRILSILLMAFLLTGMVEAKQEEPKPTDARVFALEPVSVFSLSNGYAESGFKRGQRATCQKEVFALVQSYPTFVSDAPLYGSICIGGTYAEANSGVVYHFALDESKGSGTGYDRLYMDQNRDVDLANDRPVSADPEAPGSTHLNYAWIKKQVCFRPVDLMMPLGTGTVEKPLEIMPRLVIAEEDNTYMSFVTTRAHKADINIAGERFTVLLGHTSGISGWFDQPHTTLHLIPPGRGQGPSWWGSDQLCALHQIKGGYYQFSASPAGDRLTAQPYQGDWGVLEVGDGGRQIKDLGLRGSVMSRQVAAPVGKMANRDWPEMAKSCQLPVGAYAPSMVTVTLGRLDIKMSYNYHSDGIPRDRGDRSQVYPFKISSDKPFVMDFSNPPEVLFASPRQSERFKPGDEILVKAVLIDPQWDTMIRGLTDTTRKQDKEFKTPDGTTHTYKQDLSLDPTVTITRANGQQVAEGLLPFG